MDGLRAGIENMLRNCAGLAPGQSLLILTEGDHDRYYDPALAPAVALTALAMGLTVRQIVLPFKDAAEPPPPAVMAEMARADAALFLSRRGDQLRFCPSLAGSRPVVCYALDRAMMASGFGRVEHGALKALLACLDDGFAAAGRIRVTCPLGTDFSGPGTRFAGDGGAVTVRRFPLSVFTPLPADGFAGRIAVAGFLTGTGNTYYRPYTLPLGDVLTIRFEGRRILGFEGPDAARASAHFHRVGARTGCEALTLHSWHAGIHPGCAYLPTAAEDVARWSGGAFGNPRVLHMHACGAVAPGEISLNVIDPTITLDGVALWQAGRLNPRLVAGGGAIIARHPVARRVFARPSRAVGLDATGRLSANVDPARVDSPGDHASVGQPRCDPVPQDGSIRRPLSESNRWRSPALG